MSFIPFIVLLSGLGFSRLLVLLKDKKWPLALFVIIITIGSSFALHGIQVTYTYKSSEKPAIISEYYEFFKNRPLSGPIITSDPVVGVYTDKKVILTYFVVDFLKQSLREVDFAAAFFDTEEFQCLDSDSICKDNLKNIISNMLKTKLIFDKEYSGRHKYIFTTDEYYESLPKQDLYVRFNLSAIVQLSKYPDDTFIASVILEDFPSLNDNHSDIWMKDEYLKIMNFFMDKNLSISAAVIPTHLEDLNKSELQYLNNTGFAIIQNGFSHTNELSGSYAKQKNDILDGKNIIKDLLGRNVSAFIPPFYSADQNTISALQDLGFDIYVTNIGDIVTTDMDRYDHKLTLISNWMKKEFLSEDELVKNIDYIENYEPYLLVSIYYYMFDNKTFDYLNLFYYHTKDYRWMNIYELDAW